MLQTTLSVLSSLPVQTTLPLLPVVTTRLMIQLLYGARVSFEEFLSAFSFISVVSAAKLEHNIFTFSGTERCHFGIDTS